MRYLLVSLRSPSAQLDPVREGLRQAVVILLTAATALALPAKPLLPVAHAAPPPGTDLNSPVHQWFERQAGANGVSCCSMADGHLLEDGDWRMKQDGSGYEVRLVSTWHEVPKQALIDPRKDPNPTGHAVVWYEGRWDIAGAFNPIIHCFLPGYMY